MTIEQEEKILTDEELLRIIKDLLIIQKCTNNSKYWFSNMAIDN